MARKLKFSGNKNMEKGSILTSKISLPYHSNLPPEVKRDKTASLAIKEKKNKPLTAVRKNAPNESEHRWKSTVVSVWLSYVSERQELKARHSRDIKLKIRDYKRNKLHR